MFWSPRPFQYRSLREKRLRSVVGPRRYRPPHDSVLLHFHVHLLSACLAGYQSHQCCLTALPCTDPRPLLSGLVRSGVYPQERDECAHLHDGTWRLSPQAGLPVLPVGLVCMHSTRWRWHSVIWGSGSHLCMTVTSQRGSFIGAPLVRAHRSLRGPLVVPTVVLYLGYDI